MAVWITDEGNKEEDSNTVTDADADVQIDSADKLRCTSSHSFLHDSPADDNVQQQLPAGRKLVRMLWVYKIKRDGTLKARLCVMGSAQRPGVDFDQTYSATMRAASLRLLAAISAAIWSAPF